MIVDAHHHLWSLADGERWAPGVGYRWLDGPCAPIRRDYTVADLRGQLAATGVGRTVLVEAGVCRHEETVAFQRLAEQTREIAGVVGYLDLRDPPPLAQVQVSPMLVGVRDQVQAYPRDFLREPAVLATVARLAEAGLAVDLVIRPDQLPAAAAAARAVPQARFVLDHLAKPPIRAGAPGVWQAGLVEFARCPNSYAKLSGLVTEADWRHWTVAQLRPYVAAALACFGPDRLLWGSDWPVVELAGGYRRWLAAARELVPVADHDRVFGATATEVYRLQPD